MNYPWYEKIPQSDQIEQGDLIYNCPIIKPPPSITLGEIPEVEVDLIDSVILSQSCDLVNGKVNIVLVCPFYKLEVFLENLPDDQQTRKAKKKNVQELKKGNFPSYHLLNKSTDHGLDDYLVVDFKNVYGIHVDNLRHVAAGLGERVRLLPPYREHLSQAFARYFMRVGLPQDLRVEGY